MSLIETPVTVIKQTYSPVDKLMAFADTNALLEYTDHYQRPFIHFWTTEVPTLILGINDRHLPDLSDGLSLLKQRHYDFFLRNSGGLAVISDPGVLNISMFIPDQHRRLSVDEAYEIIAGLVRATFPTFNIRTYEITRSYCPGKFDLSVNGQKIAGIAQRRMQNAVVLMLYLSVNGDQDQRSETVAAFYTAGDAYSQTRWSFPKVDKTTMTTIETLGFPNVTVDQIETNFLKSMNQSGAQLDLEGAQQLYHAATFRDQQKRQLQKMRRRNEQLPVI